MSVAGVALRPIHKRSGSVCSRSSESIVIYLTVAGSVIPMRIMESDSIAAVKLKIQICKGFVVKKQKLVFGGRELSRNNSLLKDYGVSSGDVLHLILRVSDLLVITVKSAIGKQFEFEVDRFRNVRYLRQLVAEKAKGIGFINADDHKILCNGEDLDDQRLIDDVWKKNDAVIHLVVQKSGEVPSSLDERNPEKDDRKSNPKKPPDIDSPLQPIIVNPGSKLSPTIWSMLDSTSEGLQKGKKPIRSSEGTGGTYFMQHPSGNRYVAVFKPIDEEPMAVNNPQGLPVSSNGEGLKRGTKVGEGAFREVAAYLLDHPKSGPRTSGDMETGFAGVPPTVMVKCLNGEFNHLGDYDGGPENIKVGSLQMFMKNCGSCEDMGPRDFPVEEVHKITVFDIRTANADRHAGNILMNREGDRIVLIPIDHGYCLPENFEDCTFDWLYWPQAREPYSRETLDYIQSLDAEQDLALLSSNGWNLSPECARTLRISTMLLKKGAARGLSAYAIGRILCRETLHKESAIEKILEKAHSSTLPGTSEAGFLKTVTDLLDFELDKAL
ncbi:phosphatidylinositol 4-kinase gamma 4-like [Cynara cardunculus var. scolymus]|uniref:1-phosphatidylinositol 4-kinase n=1 Tax=Cynara cardunculus var. scolymus TaxID=59895 RepID=A0A103XFX2_CYNCS|nr:phosphatidylinositol 4-kinase gamma 4-like [Cynara cardunculus var. scolymus]KVH90006.1 Phosphatidylinositol 3-/4-kinase, catalytic domain-containing protein [Cynara cardunculus var. scolymus]